MIYGSEIFIKAHMDRTNPYFNHYYDRYVRDGICSKCGRILGEQTKYDGQENFRFGNEKDNYRNCPYCGHKFKK